MAVARRYDFDLVLAGSFGGSGEIAETVASHLAVPVGGSWRIGLWRLAEPARPEETIGPRIAALVRAHVAVPIPPDALGVLSRLVQIYEPRLLALPDVSCPSVRADSAVVILAEAPATRSGPVF